VDRANSLLLPDSRPGFRCRRGHVGQRGEGPVQKRPYGTNTHARSSVTDPWQYAGGYADSIGLYKFGNTDVSDPLAGMRVL
jgi:hypothetical protein